MQQLLLSAGLMNVISSEMKGKKLEKLVNSVNLINSSLNSGGWLPGASRSADSGFYQGCGIRVDTKDEYKNEALHELKMSLHYGYPVKNVEASLKVMKDSERKKFSLDFVKAWMELCNQKTLAIKALTAARPLPVVTSVGLSPKVTKTLKEMNLDVDLPTVKPAKIESRMVNKLDREGNEVRDPRTNEIMQEPEYFVNWTPGIHFGVSRFYAGFGECEACGKNIPSGRFVPVEVFDKKSSSLVGLWLGCDCAKNIFGVKDIGIKKA